MRTLKFIVNGQIITRAPKCDFSNLVPGSNNYIEAKFMFSNEWDGFTKVAAFYSPLGKEYPPQVLTVGKSCVIPKEALTKRSFKIQIIGMKDDHKLTTNKLLVCQNGGEI